jgi:hypothetical protein
MIYSLSPTFPAEPKARIVLEPVRVTMPPALALTGRKKLRYLKNEEAEL